MNRTFRLPRQTGVQRPFGGSFFGAHVRTRNVGRKSQVWLLPLVFALLAGCGGGGSAAPIGHPDQSGISRQAGPPPDLVVLFVSGHSGLGSNAPPTSYLDEDLGPMLEADLLDAGYTVEVGYYVDWHVANGAAGFSGLRADLEWIRDNWHFEQVVPTRTIVVAHSHGGVWATGAIAAVPDLPIRLQVALDHSSFGWSLVGHDGHDDGIGGDPRDRFSVAALGACAVDGGLPSEDSPLYDIEDVALPNVAEAFEVRSGEQVVSGQLFDEKWNIRLDGSSTGLFCLASLTSHDEVQRTDGPTYPAVSGWILERLALDP